MYVQAHQGTSIYAFGLDRKRPGFFTVAFLNKPIADGGSIDSWVRRVSFSFPLIALEPSEVLV